ncbi:MAG: maleylacetoacetate isomerase [Thiothrix sp.]|nr:MAG: maleylacetoacetate isomerase [Thiothrix sp.]
MIEQKPLLHNYFRSSTSIRLRAALNYKGVDYEYVAHNLRTNDNFKPEYLAKNPTGLVPALELANGTVLTQSLAIIEWLEETRPNPPLLPSDPVGRAQVRALAYMIACEIHPLNNLRVLDQVRAYGQDEAGVTAWFHKWVHTTFTPLEHMLATSPNTGTYCYGDTPTMADVCLFAQMFNNQRFKVDTSVYPTIERIYSALNELEPFQQAAPAKQPDAVD